MSLRWWGLVGLSLVSCSPPQGNTALRVSIQLETGVVSKCLRIEFKDTSGNTLRTSSGAPTQMRTELLAGVVRGDLPQTVVLQAFGFADTGCETPTSPEERSDAVEATFPTPPTTIRDVSLLVKRNQMMSVDADQDGSPASADCDDRDARRRPGLAEDCTDGKDNDCNQLADCGDGVCTGRQCKGPGSQCLPSGFCVETLCEDGFDNDQDGTSDCGDSDCDARPCTNGGTCRQGACANANNERGLCADGQDNDNDGRVDCADSDCLNGACSDGFACTQNETCSAAACIGGVAVVCPPSANACEVAQGQCQEPDGGCHYAKAPTTTTCNDGLRCTESDSCDGDGGCLGTPKACAAPPAGSCWEPVGTCIESDGGCAYTIAVGRLSCVDGDLCTVNDACLADGGCLGAPLDCTNALPPDECQTPAGTCTAGSCDFVPRTGACSLGTCVGGVCVAVDAGVPDAGGGDGGTPSDAGVDAGPVDSGVRVDAGVDAGVPFVIPSNVPIGDIETAPAFAHLDIQCATTITLDPVGISSNGCTAPALPAVRTVGQANAPTLMVFVVDRLTIRSGAQLRIQRGNNGNPSDRAPVIAVRGNATIDGVINVNALESTFGQESGPGGNGDFCPASTPGTGRSNRSGGGQGGGYGLNGGSGGDGADNGGNGAAGRAANGNDTLIPLRGGCGGSVGGGGTSGQYGRAGGALQLWVRDQLVVNGSILANGARGLATTLSTGGGGGGGGSGGAILIEATRVTIGSSAIIAANGGSGAEGTDDLIISVGENGQNGTVGVSTANGGTGNAACGGRGGAGGALAGNATSGQEGGVDNNCNRNNFGGGGGGGGSVGRVRINTRNPCTIATQARLSPRPVSMTASCAP